jgi:hypothetical protein
MDSQIETLKASIIANMKALKQLSPIQSHNIASTLINKYCAGINESTNVLTKV